MILSDKTYDTLAFIQRFLAPIGTFIVALCGIWGWEWGEQVAATIAALTVLLSAWLKACSNKYFDAGTITFLNTMHEEDGEGK